MNTVFRVIFLKYFLNALNTWIFNNFIPFFLDQKIILNYDIVYVLYMVEYN